MEYTKGEKSKPMNKKLALDVIYLILKSNEDWEFPYLYEMVEEVMRVSK